MWHRKKKNITKYSGHFIPQQRPRAAHALSSLIGPSGVRIVQKVFTFWEYGETFRKFLSDLQFFMVSKSIKR
jgi:hypothetical protein